MDFSALSGPQFCLVWLVGDKAKIISMEKCGNVASYLSMWAKKLTIFTKSTINTDTFVNVCLK